MNTVYAILLGIALGTGMYLATPTSSTGTTASPADSCPDCGQVPTCPISNPNC